MSAGKYDFMIEQGATVLFELQYRDANEDPISLEEYSAAMRISSNFSGSANTTNYVTLTSLSGSQYDDGFNSGSAFLSISGSDLETPPSSGSIGVYIGYEITDDFTFKSAKYDLEITSGSIRTRILQGNVILSQQVT